MSKPPQPAFDYSRLPQETASEIKAAAKRITARLKRTAEDVIAIGQELNKIKPKLKGYFDDWFEATTGLDRHMAYKFIRAADKLGTVNNLPLFSPTALYLLAAPSTPDTIVNQAVAKAESGEKVTVADVRCWQKEYPWMRGQPLQWKSAEREQREVSRETAAFGMPAKWIRGTEHQVPTHKRFSNEYEAREISVVIRTVEQEPQWVKVRI